MRYFTGHRFQGLQWILGGELLSAPEVNVGEWQSQDVRDKPEMVSYELQNVVFNMEIPLSVSELQQEVKPNLPWAEDHFLERVSGKPLNPPPSEGYWPYAQANNSAHKSQGEKFSHTYPERFYPKYANVPEYGWAHEGIRFKYGDLDDVVEQLARSPMTRQAYLPVWFPEDTGAVHKERVPCSLGYQFLIRNRKLNISYFIRSCDYMRHFKDDVYMAARLAQWVSLKMRERHRVMTQPSELIMHTVSMHIFAGDRDMLTYRRKQEGDPRAQAR